MTILEQLISMTNYLHGVEQEERVVIMSSKKQKKHCYLNQLDWDSGVIECTTACGEWITMYSKEDEMYYDLFEEMQEFETILVFDILEEVTCKKCKATSIYQEHYVNEQTKALWILCLECQETSATIILPGFEWTKLRCKSCKEDTGLEFEETPLDWLETN